MGQRVIYVMTHDSIGLGEDGPTHQPVEHFAALRAIPNLNLYRPADIVETAEAWQMALSTPGTPSVLALSRQGLPQLRLGADITENKTKKGGYVLAEASVDAEIVLVATGSEVCIADEARQMLEAEGHPTRLVSVPCLDLILGQDKAYQNQLTGNARSVVVVEAGLDMGWASFIGRDYAFVGMAGFGASAPAPDLYTHFGITAKHITAAALAQL
jgi:transketolase